MSAWVNRINGPDSSRYIATLPNNSRSGQNDPPLDIGPIELNPKGIDTHVNIDVLYQKGRRTNNPKELFALIKDNTRVAKSLNAIMHEMETINYPATLPQNEGKELLVAKKIIAALKTLSDSLVKTPQGIVYQSHAYALNEGVISWAAQTLADIAGKYDNGALNTLKPHLVTLKKELAPINIMGKPDEVKDILKINSGKKVPPRFYGGA